MLDLPKSFESWLLAELTVSEKTLRNYLSDFSHFTGWAIFRLKTNGLPVFDESDLIQHISPHLFEDYKRFLLSNKTPMATINRRLSTLRHFGRFLHQKGILDFDPGQTISNLTTAAPKKEKELLLESFRKHLEAEGASPKTVKNYLSDVRGFLEFLEFSS